MQHKITIYYQDGEETTIIGSDYQEASSLARQEILKHLKLHRWEIIFDKKIEKETTGGNSETWVIMQDIP